MKTQNSMDSNNFLYPKTIEIIWDYFEQQSFYSIIQNTSKFILLNNFKITKNLMYSKFFK